MLSYVLRRLVSVAFTFIAVSIIIFLMMHAVPGGPFDANDMPVSEAVRAKLMAQLGLDQPLYVQYLRYMWGVLHFDFGVPYQSPGESVLQLLSRAWLPSLVLGGLGVLIGAPLGILLGMAAALNRNSWIDYLASAVATLGLTIPVFVTSMLLILVFAVWLKWLPASGWPDPERWILPIVAYAAIPIATYARYTRSAMLDTMSRPFVTVLRAKGLGARAAQYGGLAVLALQLAALAFLAQTGRGIGGNTVYHDQIALVRQYVPPGDAVAAGQSGTLGFFRDRVINTDGKVNLPALAWQDRMGEYLRRRDVKWFVDWPYYVNKYLGVPLGPDDVPAAAANGWRLVAERNYFYLYEYVGEPPR